MWGYQILKKFFETSSHSRGEFCPSCSGKWPLKELFLSHSISFEKNKSQEGRSPGYSKNILRWVSKNQNCRRPVFRRRETGSNFKFKVPWDESLTELTVCLMLCRNGRRWNAGIITREWSRELCQYIMACMWHKPSSWYRSTGAGIHAGVRTLVREDY